MAVSEELKLVIKTEVDKATKDMNRFRDQVEKSKTSVSKMLTALGGFAAAAVSIHAIAKFGKEAVQAYLEQEKAVTQLNAALKATGIYTPAVSQNLQDLASELQRTTAYGDEATLSAAGLLQSLGKLNEKALSEAIPLVHDLAAGMGLDLQTAASLIGKTLGSTTNALSRYGIVLDATAPPSEKLAALTEQINASFGGMAKAMGNTFQGRLQRLKNAWGDIQEILGKFLLESAEPAMTWLLDFLQNSENIQVITRIIRGFGAVFGTVFSTVIVMIKTTINYYKLWANALKSVWNILKVVFDPTQWGSGRIKDELRNLADATVQIGRDVVEDWASYAGKMADRWKGVFGEAGEEVIETVRNTYRLATEEGTEAAGVVQEVVTAYGGQLSKLQELNRAYIDHKSEIELVAEEYQKLMEAQDERIPEVVQKLNEMNRTWQSTGYYIAEATNRLEEYREAIEGMTRQAMEAFASTFADTMVETGDIWEAFKDAGKEAIATVVEALGHKAIAKAAELFAESIYPPNPLGLAASAAWTAAATAAYTAAGAIRAMAEGGIVTKPTLALIGEKGPEAVVPLGKGKGATIVNNYNIQGSLIREEDMYRKAIEFQKRVARGY